jgi:hypothetical protein
MRKLLLVLFAVGIVYAQDGNAPNTITLNAANPPIMAANQITVAPNPGCGVSVPKYYWVITNYPIGSTLSGPAFANNSCISTSTVTGNFDIVSWPLQSGATSYGVIYNLTSEPFPQLGQTYTYGTGTTANTTGTAKILIGSSGRFSVTIPTAIAPAVCNIFLDNLDSTAPFLNFNCPSTTIPNLVSPNGGIDSSSVGYIDPATGAVSQTQAAVNNTQIRSTDFCPISQVNGVTDNTTCLQNFLNACGANPSTTCLDVSPTTIGAGYVCSSLSWGSNNYTSLTIQKGAYPSCSLPAPDLAHFVVDQTTNPIIPWPSSITAQDWSSSYPASGTVLHGSAGEVASFNTGTIVATTGPTVFYTSLGGTGQQMYRLSIAMLNLHAGTAGSIITTIKYTDNGGSQITITSPTLTLGSLGTAANGVYMLAMGVNTTISYTVTLTSGGGGTAFQVYGVLEEF